MTTARENFVNCYTLVMDNDQDGFEKTMEFAREAGNVVSLSDTLREEWEDYIESLATREDIAKRSLGAQLVREIYLGWGSDVWDDIARHYLAKVEEEKSLTGSVA